MRKVVNRFKEFSILPWSGSVTLEPTADPAPLAASQGVADEQVAKLQRDPQGRMPWEDSTDTSLLKKVSEFLHRQACLPDDHA